MIVKQVFDWFMTLEQSSVITHFKLTAEETTLLSEERTMLKFAIINILIELNLLQKLVETKNRAAMTTNVWIDFISWPKS